MRYPDKIFVGVEEEGSRREEFLRAEREVKDLAEIGERRVIGVYRLDKIIVVEGLVGLDEPTAEESADGT